MAKVKKYLGEVLKFQISFASEDGNAVDISKINDFKLEFFASPTRKVVISKEEAIEAEEDSFIVFVDTTAVGVGELKYKTLLSVLDPQYPEVYRPEVMQYNTDIEICR